MNRWWMVNEWLEFAVYHSLLCVSSLCFLLVLLFYYDFEVAGVRDCAALGHVFSYVSLDLFVSQAEVDQVLQGFLVDHDLVVGHFFWMMACFVELAALAGACWWP